MPDEQTPLRMTLEEQELVVNVLRNYHRDHTGDPEFGEWPQVAHRLAGRLAAPATQRDDTAELAEALKDVTAALMAADPKAHFKADVERAEAALAKWKERS